ncbi:hypothetical protein CCGE525_37565 (plasmid) [Rhizobium jaguaris]|uniref:Uncharacterized protein n=1 Tax=Rhizobium jaguaris TaxID=1312183 RepID=A0A387G9E6_9HYPH|nr:hypothetical protein CCGE525_37565 [Rhizobium jaguaris]
MELDGLGEEFGEEAIDGGVEVRIDPKEGEMVHRALIAVPEALERRSNDTYAPRSVRTAVG